MSEDDRMNRYLEAYLEYLDEDYEAAVKLIDEVMEDFPEEREARIFRAWCILCSRDYERAYQAFHEIVQTDGDNPQVWQGLSNTLWAMDDLTVALSCINKAIASYPQSTRYVCSKIWPLRYAFYLRETELHQDKGMILLDMYRLEESLDSFNEAIRLDDKNHVAWAKKGMVLRYMERYEDALEAFKGAAIREKYHYPLPSDYEGIEHYEDYPPSPKTWQQMLDESDENILREIGLCLDYLGRHEESLELYTRLTERNPEDAGAWFWKAYALSMNDRKEEAIECYNHSNELDPDPDAYMNIGYILKGMGRFEEAERAYEGALDLDPQMYDAWEHIGDCQAATGRGDEAVVSYRNYLGDDGEGAWVRVKLADSLKSVGRADEAEHEYREALASSIRLEERYGENPFTFQARADTLTALGRKEEAEEWRNKAAKLWEHEEEEETTMDEAEQKNRAVFVEVPKKIDEMTEEEKEAFAIEVLNALKGSMKKS